MACWWTAPVLHTVVAILCLVDLGQAGDAPRHRVVTGAKPGCPERCGDVLVPYPFGIGGNCSLPGFQLQCNRTSTGDLLPHMSSRTGNITPVVNISLFPAPQVSILMKPFSTCALDENSTSRPLTSDLLDLDDPFVVSSADNVLTVLGCNTIAYTYANGKPIGCATLCTNGSSSRDDGKCSGVGCCQVAMPLQLPAYKAYMGHVMLPTVISYKPATLSINKVPNKPFSPAARSARGCTSIAGCPRRHLASTSSYDTYCGSVFLSEGGHYVFKQDDAVGDISNRTYPVRLDWSVTDADNCTDAQANGTTYACKSLNSLCLDSASAIGYSCQCSPGFHGNPYLPNGCQDIDECQVPNTCKAGRVCINKIGNYTCVCPSGTVDEGRDYYCVPVDIVHQNSHKTTSGIALGIGISFVLLLLVASCTTILVKLKSRREEQCKQRLFKKNCDMLLKQQLSCEGESIIERLKIFPLRELEKATNNFDNSCIVGKGGHGIVYKALLNLRVVAIKMSKVTSQIEIEQFINEVVLLSQVNHRNIVKFIGCCLETEVPILVYEFISNGTLFDHLRTRDEENLLHWVDRLRIATEITSALAYLHSAANISIYHRDIKTSNILLDEKLMAKISDFGASKSIAFDQTHVTTNVQGTLGYLDPEYMQTGQLTEKSDVYSLGVILVELLTSQNPASRIRSQETGSPISSFIQAMQENRLLEVVDNYISGDKIAEEVEIFARLAFSTLSMNGKDRPTMKYILTVLESLLKISKSKQ